MESMETRKQDMIVNHPASLVNIVKALQRDAVDDNDSRSFLDGMKSFIKDYYCFLDQYKDKREKAEVNLFESPEAEKWN